MYASHLEPTNSLCLVIPELQFARVASNEEVWQTGVSSQRIDGSFVFFDESL